MLLQLYKKLLSTLVGCSCVVLLVKNTNKGGRRERLVGLLTPCKAHRAGQLNN